MSRNYVLNTGNGVSLFVGSNQNVGFHTAAPSEKLHFDKGHAKFNSNIYVMKKIGISTSNPSVELDVTGDAHVTGDISIEGDMQIYNPIMVNGFYVTKNTAMSNNILKTAISSAVHNMDVNEAGTKFAIANRGQEFRFIATSNETNIFKIDGMGNLMVYGDVLPDVNVAYDLGSSNKRFKDLYLSGNTINMDNVTISKDITTGNIKLQDATTGSMKSLMVSELQLVDNDKIFKIKHDSNIGKVKFVTMDNSNNELDEPPIPNLFTYNSNIGIGISNPITRLHVSDDAIINTSKLGSYLGDKSYAMFAHSNSSTTTGYALLHHSSGDTYINAASSKTIRFRINNNDAVAINSAGRLGIGLSNPQVSLEVNSTDSIKVPVGTTSQRPSTAQQGYVRYNSSINTFEGYGAGNTWGSLGGIKDTNQDTYISAESFPTSNDDILRFFNSNNETLRITAAGRIGISNQSPSERFEVSGGNAKFNSNIYILGNIGVGTSNPTTRLEVNGSAKITSNLEVLGDFTIRGTTTYVDSTTVNIADNIIRLNNGATYTSALQAGFEVNRGTGYSNYLLVFDETTDTLQTGMQGALQAVPNIDGTMISNGVLLYDNTNKKITSCNNFVYNGTGLGIGTTTPTEQLDINKNAKINSNLYVSSRLGVATSNPTEALDIIGNLKASSNMYVVQRQSIGKSNPTEVLDIIGNLKASSNIYSMSRIGISTSNPTESLDIIGNFKASSNIYSMLRIGISTSNPTEALDIIGNLKASSNMYVIQRQSIGKSNPTESLDIIGNFKASSNIYSMSRIGLGNSNPAYQLHASGTIASSNTVYLSDGTVTAPVITWSNDLDTGIYHLSNHSIGISTGGYNALTINNNKVGINTLNPEFALDVMDTVHISSNILFGDKTSISSNILFPSSALAVNNPSGSLNGINYTFVSTNLAGNWDGNWWYDYNYNSSLTCDPYVSGVFNGVTATSNVDGSNVIRGQISGITGSSNFILKGYRFENSNASITNLPKKLYLLGSYDNTNWNTIDYYLTNSNVYSTPLGTNITGLDRQVENTSNYRYYRVVFNELLSGNGFTIQEFRWYILSINSVYKNGIYYNTSNNMYGINTSIPKYTLDVTGDISSSNIYLSSAGTATAPGYSWTEDSNTGMYRVGENSIGFSTGGVNRVIINSTGISGNGSGLTSLNADNISSGTLPIARGGTGATTSTGGGAVVLANDSVLTGNTTAYNLQVDRTLKLISWNFNNDCKINFYSPNTGSNVNAEIWYEDYNNNVGSGFRFRSATRNAIGAPADIWFQHDGRIHCQYLTSYCNIIANGVTSYGNIIANGGNLESYSSNVSSVNPIFNAAKKTDGVVHNTITLGTTYGLNATANLRFADNRHLTSDKLNYSSNHLGIGFWNNDDILNVHASRRVGINTTRPTEFLDITGNLKASSNIYSMSCIGISTSNPTEALDIIGNTKISSNLYVINNIGIGLSNPSITLEVNGGVKVRSNVEILGDLTIRGTTTTVDSTTVNITDNIIRLNNGAVFNASLQSGIEINRGTGNSNYYLVYDEISDVLRAGFTGTLSAVATRDDSPPSFSIPYYNFATSNYTAINQFVYSNNNLGIGVTNPIYKLDTNGTIRSTLNNGAGMILESIGHIDISFSNNQSAMAQIGLAYGNTQYSSHASSNDLVIRNMKGKVILQNGSSTSALVINSNNFVGIGTNAPTVRLDVAGTTNSSTGYSSGTAVLQANDSQYGNWKVTGNAQGSHDGIRFTTADITVVAGNAGVKRSGFYNNGVGWALYIDENRNMFCPGDITGFWSDKRLKSNLEEIKDHDHILSSLTAYRFSWNEIGQKILQRPKEDVEIGLIAQDVQSVLPQAVKVNKAGISVDSNEDEQNDYLTINYDKLVPILIEGYKDQKLRIAKLEEEITYLKEKIK